MKKIQTIVACAMALVLVGATTLKAAESGQVQTKATVRSLHGDVKYQAASGGWAKLAINMELDSGVNIRTGTDSYTDLSINGVTSAVRITENTMMAIPTMTRIGMTRDADTETMLDLTTGSILGNVKKISANSRYEIKTPHGVAGIRGTDFQVTVLNDGTSTFTSIQGQVIVSAVVANVPVIKVLRDGESWTPGSGDVVPTPLNLINDYRNLINNTIIPNTEVTGGATTTPPPPLPVHTPVTDNTGSQNGNP